MVRGVLFDLLSGLLDSWTLWNAIAGDAETGRRWRLAYLDMTYALSAYHPYEEMIVRAAESLGLPKALGEELVARYGELAPWPEAPKVLRALRELGVRTAVVTNCSERLGRIAVERLGVPFDVVVTAERAGAYKPDPRPYRLGIRELGCAAEECVFVAGSAYDLIGAAGVGLPTFWHNRLGLTPPAGAPRPLAEAASLQSLTSLVTKAVATETGSVEEGSS